MEGTLYCVGVAVAILVGCRMGAGYGWAALFMAIALVRMATGQGSGNDR